MVTNKENKNMIIDELNLEIKIVKIDDNFITINFQSENKLELLAKNIIVTDINNKTIESICSKHGVIEIVLNNSETNKIIEFESNVKNYETISLVIKNRITHEKYPVKLKLH